MIGHFWHCHTFFNSISAAAVTAVQHLLFLFEELAPLEAIAEVEFLKSFMRVHHDYLVAHAPKLYCVSDF